MPIAYQKAFELRSWVAPQRLACIASLGLVTAAYAPLLTQYADQLWAIPEYRLAPVILIVAALSAQRRVATLTNVQRGPLLPAALTCGLAAAVFVLAAVASAPELAGVSLLLLCVAIAIRWGGQAAVRGLLGPGLFACLLLRLPGNLDLLGFQAVARFDLSLAHRVLDAFGVVHDLDGLSIVLPAERLWMGRVGFSLFSPWCGMALAAAVCAWQPRTRLGALLLLTTSCGWFVLVDVLRVVCTVMLCGRLESYAIDGFVGGVLDIAAAALMLLLVISSDQVGRLFRKALRWDRPLRKRRSKAAPAPVAKATVSVTGLTLDASGQLVKVVREQVLESPEQTLPSENAPPVPPGRRMLVPDWVLLAVVYGALCAAETIWLPGVSSADASWQLAAEVASHAEMPAQSGGWRLEAAANVVADCEPSDFGWKTRPIASWHYRRGHLKFVLEIRARRLSLAGPVERVAKPRMGSPSRATVGRARPGSGPAGRLSRSAAPQTLRAWICVSLGERVQCPWAVLGCAPRRRLASGRACHGPAS